VNSDLLSSVARHISGAPGLACGAVGGGLGSGPDDRSAAGRAGRPQPAAALAFAGAGGAGADHPSLALLALFYPLLLLLSNLAKGAFGHGFSALGFLPSLLALTLYSMLPILRNTVAGLTGVDPAVVEAARGVGMTDRQRLWRV
jgi:osmoprotectant transport system permease protein